MRTSILLALATSALAIGAPVHAEAVPAAPSTDTAAMAPDFKAAVAAPGREAADVKLDESRKPAEVLAFMGLETGDTEDGLWQDAAEDAVMAPFRQTADQDR